MKSFDNGSNRLHNREFKIIPTGKNSIFHLEDTSIHLSKLFDRISLAEALELRDRILDAPTEELKEVSRILGERQKSRIKTDKRLAPYYFKGEYRKSPQKAPRSWQGKYIEDEDIIDFIESTYSSWIGYGMTRAHLEKIDKPAYNALRNWEKFNFFWHTLPTTKDHNDALIEWKNKTTQDIFRSTFPPAEVDRINIVEKSRKKKLALK